MSPLASWALLVVGGTAVVLGAFALDRLLDRYADRVTRWFNDDDHPHRWR